jgi:hypothetical protein
MAYKIVNGVRTEMTLEEEASYLVTVPEAAPVIPSIVTKRQIFLALEDLGERSNVLAAVAALPEPTKTYAQIELETAAVVERSNSMVALIQGALSWTDTQMDDLFVLANTK